MTLTPAQQACPHRNTVSNAAFDVCLDCRATVPVQIRRKRGRQKARDGAAAAHEAATREFRRAINKAIDEAVAALPDLTTDDIWARIPERFHDDERFEGRALGAAMTQAARDGLIERTGLHRESEREQNHARPLRVWRSLVYSPVQSALDL